MSFVSKIFGGGGGGGGDTTTTTVQQLSREQRELLNLALPGVRDIVANPPEPFPRSTVAGFTRTQKAGQQAALDAASQQVAPLAQTAAGGAESLQGFGIPVGLAGATAALGGLQPADAFLNFLLSGQAFSPETNPFLAQAAEAAIRPLEQSFGQTILPGIRSAALEVDQFGSSRQGIAEGIAGQELLAQEGDISSRIFSQGFSDVLGAATQALGTTQGTGVAAFESLLGEGSKSLFASPALGNLSLLPSFVEEGVGFQQQQLKQAKLTAKVDAFNLEQILPFLISQQIANLAFGVPGGTVTSTSSGSSGGGGIGNILLTLGGGILGGVFGGPPGAAAGASIGSSLTI